MKLFTAILPPLTLSSGATASNARGAMDDAWGISLVAPATLTSTQYYVSVEQTDTGTNFAILQSGGADVTIYAGRSLTISPFAYRQIRVETTTAEAAARTFTLAKVFPV